MGLIGYEAYYHGAVGAESMLPNFRVPQGKVDAILYSK